jgi:hypothetical protein
VTCSPKSGPTGWIIGLWISITKAGKIIKVAKNLVAEGALPRTASAGEFMDFEEIWAGAYIFENEWQNFRTRQDRELEMVTASYTYATR